MGCAIDLLDHNALEALTIPFDVFRGWLRIAVDNRIVKISCRRLRLELNSSERWPGKTAHWGKWIICLTAPTGAHDRRSDEQTTPPESQSGIQGEGGIGCGEGREDASGVVAAV